MAINGFEEYTERLSDEEQKYMLIIVERISKRIGPEKAVTNSTISQYFRDKVGVKLTGARIRKIINVIRSNGFVSNLIATSKGYYVSTDKQEIQQYIESLRQRAGAINHIADQMEKQLKQPKNEVQAQIFA